MGKVRLFFVVIGLLVSFTSHAEVSQQLQTQLERLRHHSNLAALQGWVNRYGTSPQGCYYGYAPFRAVAIELLYQHPSDQQKPADGGLHLAPEKESEVRNSMRILKAICLDEGRHPDRIGSRSYPYITKEEARESVQSVIQVFEGLR